VWTVSISTLGLLFKTCLGEHPTQQQVDTLLPLGLLVLSKVPFQHTHSEPVGGGAGGVYGTIAQEEQYKGEW
jgi:hypothetical protein